MSYILPAYMRQHLSLMACVLWCKTLTSQPQIHNHHALNDKKYRRSYNSHGTVQQGSSPYSY
ncbi:hypothetical protein SFK1770_1109 [Shigella flexneri K-1770]|nr:hypothetical protein SFK1770_1109 [Shigella flexneri K-1770]